MLMKFVLVALVLCAGFGSAHPSAAEFNLFCRILAKANDLMYGPDYVYDENVDRAILKDMEMLYNATTSNMNEFRKTLWVTKDFFEEHPPPTQSENRKKAHREIKQFIDEGEKKIQENRGLAEKVNDKINDAKLSVARGLYGEHVTQVPKDEKNLTEILGNTSSTFEDKGSAANSCGNGGKKAGKTLINDLFCVCAGGDANDAEGPCHPKIWPPKSWPRNGGGDGSWTLIKFGIDKPPLIQSFNESFQKIEHVCREEMIQGNVKPENMAGLLREYVGMIEMGPAKTDKNNKKIFGHSERSAGGDNNKVTQCTGAQGSWGSNDPEKNNNNICVDYTKNQSEDKKSYNIPWHEKFKNYTTIMQDAKKIEERILKNRADLLLLKSQAWIAYSREKDDETSNLDDMNMSNLLDASDKKDTMAEKKSETREYIDVSEETTQQSQPSQPAQGQGAPGNPPHYILISSTETSQPSPKKTDECKGGGRVEPEVTVISSESTTQEAASPSQGPSQATSQPPTQSAKRLRDEKTGE